MFGFSWIQSNKYKKQVELQEQAEFQAYVENETAAIEDSLIKADVPAEEEKPAEVKVETPVQKQLTGWKSDSLLMKASTAQAEVVKLSNDLMDVEFSTLGAQPYTVMLKKFTDYNEAPLYIFKEGGSRYDVKVYADFNGHTDLINTGLYTFDVVEKSDSVLVMQLPFEGGGYIEQKFWLSAGSYVVKNELSFVDMHNVIPRNVTSLDIDWDIIIPRLEKGYKNEKQYSKLNYYFSGDKKPEMIARGKDQSKDITTKVRWFAFQQQFFSAILTPEKEFNSADFSVNYYTEDHYKTEGDLMLCSADLNSSFRAEAGKVVLPSDFYFGPNDYRGLKAYDMNYEKIIPLGGWMVAWFSRLVIIPCFDFLGKFINNYGLVILIMTILIKLLISPLTIKSYKSSAKMQVIKPEIDKLNERYPNEKDAMKKQQAMMQLYQKAGISPMGGCLPMLLQMPILFAMFRFFPASIELRHQSFLWADDLSAYDSIVEFGANIPLLGDHLSLFALLMAISMFIYSKMTSGQMSDDPNMAGMKFMSVWLMPIMMFFICNNLSSGLSYYYLLSNIITMGITWYIRKYVVTEEKVRADMMLASSKPKQKSKWQMRLEEAQKMQEQMQKNRR